MDDDPISEALRTRRIPHGKSGKGRGKGKGGPSFNVLRAINEYWIRLGSKEIWNTPDQQGRPSCCMIIQGLTPNEDGLIATFDFERKISGVGILAGSRKDLRRIVEELEDEDDDEVENEAEVEEDTHDSQPAEDETGETGETGDGDEETPEDRLNRLTKTFEKNSFRAPKFWMHWKGHVKAGELESNTAYIVFSGNDCEMFEGSWTCDALGWDNVKIKGFKRKTHANTTFTMERAKELWRHVGGL